MTSTNNADRYSEAEIQTLIAHLELELPIETPNNIGYTFYPQNLAQAGCYFRRALADWCERRASREGINSVERSWWQEVTGALIARG